MLSTSYSFEHVKGKV